MEKVAIVGMAQTRFEARKIDAGYPDLVYEVSRQVMEKIGMGIDELDQTITASQDFWDGRTISNFAVSEACGSFLKPESKVAMDGIMAVLYAMIRVMSGQYSNCLVVAHCKMSEGPQNVIYNAVFDPIYQRHLGIDGISSSALQARAYMTRYRVSQEQCALAAVKSKVNALLNPYAMDRRRIDVEEVLKSEILADPIHRLEAIPVSDGACAIMLANEHTARRYCEKPVWIAGVGSFMDAYYLGERDLTDPVALVKSAKKAYEMAGIADPRREIDVVELSEYYSYQELLWSEGLGLCERGQGGRLLDSGSTQIQGPIPVNPSGGVLAGNPFTVAGLVRVAEAYLQLRGQAGEHQVEGAKTALAHGTTGPCGQQHCVMILKSSL